MSTTPYWQTDAEPSRPPLEGDLDCGVLIVGGGIGGLASAWFLAERGVRAVVVEARTVVSGATGRNGGFLVAGVAAMHNDARAELGRDRAVRLYRATEQARETMRDVAEEIGVRSAFRDVGVLRLAADGDESLHVRAHHAAMIEDGISATLLEEEDLPAYARRPGRCGVLVPGDGAVHPVRWGRALARAVETRGVRIFEHTTVVAPITGTQDGRFLASTTSGVITADRVIVAADAAAGRLVPSCAAIVRSRRLHMVATVPAPGGSAGPPVYPRYGYEYYQQLEDGTIVLGGFSDLDGPASYTDVEEPSAAVHAQLARYLREELRVDAPIARRWVGMVGYTDDGMPRVGEVPDRPGLYVAAGYCGTGHVNGFLAGRILAANVCDETDAAAADYPGPPPEPTL